MNISILTDIKDKYELADQATIKEVIKRHRIAQELSYQEMATVLGISINTAHSYTNISNRNKPELFTIMILAAKFGINVDEFFKVESLI